MTMLDLLNRRSAGTTACGASIALAFFLLAWHIWIDNDSRRSLSLISNSQRKNSSYDNDGPFITSSKKITFEVGAGSSIMLMPRKPFKRAGEVKVVLDDPDIIETIASFQIQPDSLREIFIPIHSKHVAGHCLISFQSKSKELENLFKTKIQVKVVHEVLYDYLSDFLGWGFFVLWGLSYYPQIFKNLCRKSVVGLSFDFIALNISGHMCFCIFNTSMMFNNQVQKAYHKLHPKGELPVKLNDVFFSVHAVTLNVITILQCLIYDRGDQSLSASMLTFVCGLWIIIISGLFAALSESVSWLRYLYFLSYIKVGTTPIKYVPQLYLNFYRRSTEGWAIQGVFLDFFGGFLCLMQMLVDAFNNDDWDGTLGNPAKLGLGMISILCNSLFLVQHYLLYPGRRRTYSGVPDKQGLLNSYNGDLGKFSIVAVQDSRAHLKQRIQEL